MILRQTDHSMLSMNVRLRSKQSMDAHTVFYRDIAGSCQ